MCSHNTAMIYCLFYGVLIHYPNTVAISTTMIAANITTNEI